MLAVAGRNLIPALLRHVLAMFNSITNNNIKDLALNRNILGSHSESFDDKVE